MAKLIDLKTYTDSRGSLTVLEKVLPFEIKRIYYIYDIPSTDKVRAGHRHIRNIQALICLKGYCEIHNNSGKVTEIINLDSPDKCLILNPEDWHTMQNFSSDAILLVAASEYYDKSDYIDEEYK
ncbi:MAG: FdtA/QdtA family cupin domain-containing protein [Candidatus Kapabacteria bacterium]|nr:FdtA/QdtA family cupin domain-containing protein [Candidatus Kapabacteria bacterium]